MPGQIENNDTIMIGDCRIDHQVAILPSIRTGCVQTDQRNPGSRFLDVNAVVAAIELHSEVAPNDRLISRPG